MRVSLEFAYWQSVLGGLAKPRISVTPYIPDRRETPPRRLGGFSAWDGIQDILADLIERFHIQTDSCLEFGVECGFSTVALSSYFDSVVGVDTFRGDKHNGKRPEFFEETLCQLSPYANIKLVLSDYREFIRGEHGSFGLIHVDIVHTFADTFACGLWSARHSRCAIFHDTESFPQVKQAVIEVARATGRRFYNFQECYGLGIVV